MLASFLQVQPRSWIAEAMPLTGFVPPLEPERKEWRATAIRLTGGAPMGFFYSLSVVKPIELVAVLIDTLVGNAQLALEGDLSGFDGKGLRGVSRVAMLLLKRNTIAESRADPRLRASD